MSQYQDEELNRPLKERWRNGTRISVREVEQQDYWSCSVAPGKFHWYDGKRRAPFRVTFQRDFPKPFWKWKATQTSVDSRAAGTCLYLPSFVLHFEKECETEVATSAFRNCIRRHFLNVCHTFDISRWSIEHNIWKFENTSEISNQ